MFCAGQNKTLSRWLPVLDSQVPIIIFYEYFMSIISIFISACSLRMQLLFDLDKSKIQANTEQDVRFVCWRWGLSLQSLLSVFWIIRQGYYSSIWASNFLDSLSTLTQAVKQRGIFARHADGPHLMCSTSSIRRHCKTPEVVIDSCFMSRIHGVNTYWAYNRQCLDRTLFHFDCFFFESDSWISLYCKDQKMAGFLFNKKMDTWLESAFRDLHIDVTTGAIF